MARMAAQEAVAAPLTFTVGSWVWVEDEKEAWVPGVVVSRDRQDVKVKIGTKLVGVKAGACMPMDGDAPDGGVDDMTKLAYLHEPGVLHNLSLRYSLDEIYTYTGKILIAVNPFQKIPHLYGAHMMDQYRGVKLGELSPHVFAIAESAYREMTTNGTSQSILVSGESGAGKTETTKLLMQYLAYIGGRASELQSVEAQVLESNPLLEAFGNAKTVRNDNSSRFGKFVQIQFDARGRISGAAIRTYLLERSRVVQLTDPERNYHAFYQLCAGASQEEAERWHLGPPESFHYLNQSSCYQLTSMGSNAEQYALTRRAMGIVGLAEGEQEAIFRVLAAILHLGNVDFAPGAEGDSSQLRDERANTHLEIAAELLRVDMDALKQCLLTRTLVTPEGRIQKTLRPEDAATGRDTLAKTIYARLFDWLVEKVNKSIGQDEGCKHMIGVLDIYGFESFDVNSFEQFCINLANEKLQQHFNQHVFKQEQVEYEEEEIDWSYIDFIDNADVLDLIEKKPMGIISLLDEQCMFPKATADTFSTKLYQELSRHPRFEKPKFSRRAFTIDHYAGKVTYDADSFLEKNKDYVVAEHQGLLSAADDPFVAGLFPASGDPLQGKSKFTSLGSGFKSQLEKLMATLGSMEPHYIRCIKPNAQHSPARFESPSVIHQLRCGGVLEAIRISCAGFPSRRPIEEFLDRFSLLAPKALTGIENEVAAINALLKSVGIKDTDFQIGRTKVFLRAGVMAMLDALRLERLHQAASVIQRRLRTRRARARFLALRAAALRGQARWRGVLARRQYALLRAQVAAAIAIQAAYRGYRGRQVARDVKKEAMATVLQAAWRMHVCRSAYLAQRKAAVAFQGQWRVKMAKRELHRLRMEARTAGKLREDKSKLEKRCEELQWRLELEKRIRTELEESKAQELKLVQAALGASQGELAAAARRTSQLEEELLRARESAANARATATTAATATASATATVTATATASTSPGASAGAGAGASAGASASAGAGAGAGGTASPLGARAGGAQSRASQPWDPVQATPSDTPGTPQREPSGGAPRLDSVHGTPPGSGGLLPFGADRLRALAQENARLREEAEAWAGRAAELAGASERVLALEALVAQREQELRDMHSSFLKLQEQYQRMEDSLHSMEKENRLLRAQTLVAATPRSQPRLGGFGSSATPGTGTGAGPGHGQGYGHRREAMNGGHPPGTGTGTGTPSTPERGYHSATPTGRSPEGHATVSPEGRRRRQILDRHQQDQDALLQVMPEHLGFSQGRPVLACTLFRSLLHWRSLEAERTNVFDRVVQTILGAVEQDPGVPNLAYWLANTTHLLCLLERTIKAGGASGPASVSTLTPTPRRRLAGTPSFGRMGFRAGAQVVPALTPGSRGDAAEGGPSPGGPSGSGSGAGGGGGERQVDAKYPALMFKQSLAASVEKLFSVIRDSVKKDISAALSACIQAPRVRGSQPRGQGADSRGMGALAHGGGAGQGGTPTRVGSREPSPQWGVMVGRLSELLGTLKANHVPPFLVRKLLTQVFSFVNVQLFNSLLLRRECCSFSNGEFIQAGVLELDQWLEAATPEYAGTAHEELKCIRQAVAFLVVTQKPRKHFAEITADLCPSLTTQQLYRISTMYWDDKYGTHSVNAEVIAQLRQQMSDEGGMGGNSFLLDDDSSIPFTVDEVTGSMPPISASNVPVPASLKDNGAFIFLHFKD